CRFELLQDVAGHETAVADVSSKGLIFEGRSALRTGEDGRLQEEPKLPTVKDAPRSGALLPYMLSQRVRSTAVSITSAIALWLFGCRAPCSDAQRVSEAPKRMTSERRSLASTGSVQLGLPGGR